MADTDDTLEFVREFLIESTENLDQLDRDLVALEENPADPERLSSIFRTVHTIKGTSGFFGFSKLGAITHSGEHLLGRLRDGKIVLNARVASVLLQLVDSVRSILDTIEKTGSEGDADLRELSRTLSRVADEEIVVTRLESGKPVSVVAVESFTSKTESLSTPVSDLSDSPKLPAAPLQAIEPEALDDSHENNAATVSVPHDVVLSESPASESQVLIPVQTVPTKSRKSQAPVADASIRVDVGLLSSILDLVGELVLARNQLSAAAGSRDPALRSVVHRIHTVTGALQEVAMKTRMQPIEQVFCKFPRIVRDLAKQCGKEVQLIIDGADTELDRSLVENIRDPLTHLIRNAVDHGIEPPDVRISRGKPSTGRLFLRAFHESGQVTVEVEDDGHGIAVDAVRQKAVSKGLVSLEAVAAMSDDRVMQFIFEPGFSTAAKVTDVSGRGVGMDVVKTNIESIGGTVDLVSRPGAGTTIRVRIPLTLAIIPALIITSGSERFAIPQAYVKELVAMRSDRTGPSIEGLDGAPVVRIRDRLLPVIFIDSWLGLRKPNTPRSKSGMVVVVHVDDYEFGLVVDGVTADEEHVGAAVETASLWIIVVKPIGSLLAPLGLYAGATVMGDGGVVLILDLRGIALSADVPARVRKNEDLAPRRIEMASRIRPQDAARYLVCETDAGRRVAVLLEHVERLEDYDSCELQLVAGRTVVQRLGFFTPLTDLDDFLCGQLRPLESSYVTAVILSNAVGGGGLSVKRIIDVVEAESLLQTSIASPGVLGTLSLGGHATEVLDIRAVSQAHQALVNA